MARDHARIQTAIWNDDDFRALPILPQWLYKALLTQPGLSYAGVLDYRPGRLADLAPDATPSKVKAAVRRLEAERFIVTDTTTEELLVRTYVRHDRVMERANMGKAVGTALQKVYSRILRDRILTELARLYEERPDLAGWEGLGDLYPDDMDTVRAMSSTIPLPMQSRM